jgi:hypothetical protein
MFNIMYNTFANLLIKMFCFRLTEARDCYVFGTILTAIMAGMLTVTPRVFEVLENDSHGYVSFSAIRSVTYPLILRSFQLMGTDLKTVIVFQCIVFVLSFGISIIMILRSGVPLLIVTGLAIGLTCNIYFNAFHFSILTESLCFSLILVLTGAFALLIKQITLLRLSTLFLISGILFTLKPAALPITIGALLSVGVLFWKKNPTHIKKKLVFCFILLFMPIYLENIAYSFFHKDRTSLLPIHIYGKSAIITALSHEAPPPTIIRAGLEDEWASYSEDVKSYLMSIKEQEALCLQLERIGDYENYAYWHLSYEDFSKNGFSSKQIFAETLRQNLFGLIKLVMINRANFLCVSTPITNLKIEKTKPLLNASYFGPEARPVIVYYIFLIFGFTHIVAVFYYLSRFASQLFRKSNTFTVQDQLAAHLLIWAEGYFWFVALFSITNPRYLMLVFPITLLAAGLFLQQRVIHLFKFFHRIAQRDNPKTSH